MHGVPKTVVFSEFSVFVKSQSQVFDSADWIAAVQGDPPLRGFTALNPQSTKSDVLAGSWCNALSCAIQNLVARLSSSSLTRPGVPTITAASWRSQRHSSSTSSKSWQISAGHMCGSGFCQTVIHFSGHMEGRSNQAQCEERVVASQGSSASVTARS